jgi:hypothetical protein
MIWHAKTKSDFFHMCDLHIIVLSHPNFEIDDPYICLDCLDKGVVMVNFNMWFYLIWLLLQVVFIYILIIKTLVY